MRGGDILNFTNRGSDYNCIKSLSKQGLVLQETQVHGKYGQYTRGQWKRVDQKPVAIPKTHRQELEDRDSKSKTLYFPISDCAGSTTRAFTHSDVLQRYNKDRKPKQSLRDFIKDNYFISDGKSQTKDFYKRTGKYDKKRQQLHTDIIRGIVESASSPKDGEKPVAVLMGGGSASGKGTLRDSVVIPKYQKQGISLGIDDCDAIKEQMPEYALFQKQDIQSAALRVHEESMDIAMEALDELIKNNKNLIFDGTMKDINKYNPIVDKLRKAGYEIQIVGADLPVETAIARSNERAKVTGRKVKEGIIYGSNGGFAATYPELIGKVDKYTLYDNSGDSPVLVQDETGIKRKDLYDKFVQKGKTHADNRRIRKMSQQYDVPAHEISEMYKNGATLDELEEYLQLGLWDMEAD